MGVRAAALHQLQCHLAQAFAEKAAQRHMCSGTTGAALGCIVAAPGHLERCGSARVLGQAPLQLRDHRGGAGDVSCQLTQGSRAPARPASAKASGKENDSRLGNLAAPPAAQWGSAALEAPSCGASEEAQGRPQAEQQPPLRVAPQESPRGR